MHTRVIGSLLFVAAAACSSTLSKPVEPGSAKNDAQVAEEQTVTASPPQDGSVLPFLPTPSASDPQETMQLSKHQYRQAVRRIPEDAPNVLIILIDDTGPALPNTYGGLVETPNLSRIADAGISYNRFHSTAMCSPTRAALLTGRNHTRVASGQITELRNDWDGFYGEIPASAAMLPKVLSNYGYSSAAFGKWHNTRPEEVTKIGPYHNWPTGLGFDYFYGFLAGEASQWEPGLVENTNHLKNRKPRVDGFENEEGYHLSKDLSETAIRWIRDHKALRPDEPFLMYWAPGALHGPHHVPKRYADKYKGKFDAGWDAYRETAFKNAVDKGWIPQGTQLTPRPETLPSWDSIPQEERAFQTRLMEVMAGFAEHTDEQVGRIFDELEAQGEFDNTLVMYIWGDNGASAEGQAGTISELLAQNQIATTTAEHIATLEQLGGLDVLGSEKTDNMYHASWAWATGSPYQGTKLMASYLGGTRQPMAVSWPSKIKPGAHRSQFGHVIDIVPTLYDVLGIQAPKIVDGVQQLPMDGKSFKNSLFDAEAEEHRTSQFFDIMGSRAMYHEGWMASQPGPRRPWERGAVDLKSWDPRQDQWELYNLEEDFSQSKNLASEYPEKLAQLKELFLVTSKENLNWPIGGGLYRLANPGDQPTSLPKTLVFRGPSSTPEVPMPRVGAQSNTIQFEVEVDENSEGVLLAVGGFQGGLTLYLSGGKLHYEYNLFEIERTKLQSTKTLSAGTHTIELVTKLQERPGGPISVKVLVDGEEQLAGNVPRTAALLFTANDNFDLGWDSLSPVSAAYVEKRPFRFSGQLMKTTIQMVD
ncbi:MAG: sulfatase-like hydrolase/transferase [Polyangiaceae bacterium]|nr:sulfatase-like hydrolase/transferase [Polyangiaceae bacterium]